MQRIVLMDSDGIIHRVMFSLIQSEDEAAKTLDLTMYYAINKLLVVILG